MGCVLNKNKFLKGDLKMKKQIEKHSCRLKNFSLRYWLYRDLKGNLVRIRVKYPPLLDFEELEPFGDKVLSPLLGQLNSGNICVVKRADFIEILPVPGKGGSQLEAFCTSGDSPGKEGNDGR